MTNLTTLTTALIAAAKDVDRTEAKVGPTKQAWAVYCATNMLAGTLTIEQVGESIVAAAVAKAGKRKGASLKSITDVSKGFSPTLAGWYYDLRRVQAAGRLKLLIDGWSLTTARRGTDPTQPKQPRKGNKAANNNAPAPSPVVNVTPPSSFEEACAAFIAAAKRAKVPTIAKSHQADLAKVIAAATTLARQVEAHIKAKAAKAPAKPVRRRKAA